MARRRKKQIVGASRLRRKLKRLPDEVAEHLRRTIAVEADRVLHEMRNLAPESQGDDLRDYRGRRRKHLRDALEVRVSKNGLLARIGLMGARNKRVFYYARFLEFGTRKMRKLPFVLPAWKLRRQYARRAVRQATVRALRAVARSRPSDV